MTHTAPSMSREQRAAQIWSLLVYAASHRQILTYGILAKLIGVPTAALGQLLKPIEALCIAHEWPPLTVLVVSDATGVPGPRFIGAADVPAAQMDVFRYEWLELQPPAPNEYLAVAPASES